MLTVAFVNPYSKHVDESLELIKYVLDDLPFDYKYVFFPEYDQPLRYSNFEEHKQEMQTWYEDALKQREEADDDEKADWDDVINYYKNQIDNDFPDSWRIPPDVIETYRSYVDRLSVVTYSFENELNSEESELYSVFMQYYEGASTTEEFLESMDKKIKMMRQEGY